MYSSEDTAAARHARVQLPRHNAISASRASRASCAARSRCRAGASATPHAVCTCAISVRIPTARGAYSTASTWGSPGVGSQLCTPDCAAMALRAFSVSPSLSEGDVTVRYAVAVDGLSVGL